MNFKTSRLYQMYTVKGDITQPANAIQNTNDGYFCSAGEYEMVTKITKHSSGVYSRKDTIKNTSGRPLTLRAVLSKFSFNGGEYEVYTQYSEWCHEGINAWNTLVSDVGIGNTDVRANTGNPPFMAIFNTQNGRGMVFHLLCASTWQIKARKNYTQNGHEKTVDVELGINEKGFSYTLAPDESLELPEILYYEFKNKADLDAYKLHRYCNDIKPARTLPLVYNTWLSNFDDISYDSLMKQLEAAKDLGMEYFTIDAGWFGKPRCWADNVGDWEEELAASVAGRMKEFSDKVREYGLKFGLWFEIERASLTSKTVREHPEHYMIENGQAFVDFSSPDACEYIWRKLVDNIDKYGIEYIKFDHNAVISFDKNNHSFLEYFRGYYEFLHRIKRERPQIYLENCASGGLRMALASFAEFDSYWMSDNHSLNMQLEIFKNTIVRMPSRALEKWMTVASIENFTPTYSGVPCEKIISSGNHDWSYMEEVHPSFLKAVMFGGPIGISCDLTALSENLKETLKKKFDEFKADRKFWMGSECHILCDTETVLALQFNDIEFIEIKIYAFYKHATQNEITLYPVLDGSASYTVGGKTVCASEIEENGVTLGVWWMERIAANEISLKKCK